MKVEYLDRIGYIRGELRSGFIIDTMGNGINDIIKSGKKVILLGAGENSFFAEALLARKGINVYGYADNSKKLQGKSLRGKEILCPYDCFKRKDIYFVITTRSEHISDVRLQLIAHNIDNYGIFLNSHFHDFIDEDIKLHKQLMEAVNEICFKENSTESVLPYGEWGSGKLGDCYWLLKSTRWSHWAYLWEREILAKHGKKVLEIGPGFGLMSLVLLKEFPEIELDWVILESKSALAEVNNEFINGLEKVKRWYSEQVNEIWGIVERAEFQLQENRYDLIFMTEVFEHFVLKPIEVVKKIRNSLTNDGILILTTPNWGHVSIYKQWEDMPEDSEVDNARYEQLLKCGHNYQYSKEELDDIFIRCDLEVVKYEISDVNNHNYMLKKKLYK